MQAAGTPPPVYDIHSLGEKLDSFSKVGKFVFVVVVVGAGGFLKWYGDWSVSTSKAEENVVEGKAWRDSTDKWKRTVDEKLSAVGSETAKNTVQLKKVSKVVDQMAHLNGVLSDN